MDYLFTIQINIGSGKDPEEWIDKEWARKKKIRIRSKMFPNVDFLRINVFFNQFRHRVFRALTFSAETTNKR